jgi:L-type amino acid transporter 6
MTSNSQQQGLLEGYRQSDEINSSSSHFTAVDPALALESPTSANHRSISPSLPETDVTSQGLTYLNGLALVIGLQFGAGIFSAPAVVSTHITSPFAGILIWLLGGLLVWTGASSFAELGTYIPQNGGIQEYLRASYGDFAGFMFSWIWISVVRPGSIAMIALIFAEHANGLAFPGGGGRWMNKASALVGIWTITAVNCLGSHTGAKVANGFLMLKLFGVFSIGVTGIVAWLKGTEKGVRGESHLGLDNAQQSRKLSPVKLIGRGKVELAADIWSLFGEYVTALLATLWVYGGWDAVGFSLVYLLLLVPFVDT